MIDSPATDGVVVPAEQLSAEALTGLIEAFINREGTDYGEVEWSLEEKVAQVRELLRRREVAIVFDPLTESCTLVSREALRGLGHSAGG